VSNKTFYGASGSSFNGSKLLGGWVRDGDRWFVTGQTQQFAGVSGVVGYDVCNADSPNCNKPEDVFFDDVPLKHASSPAEVGAGTYHFDYATDRIYIGRDPSGHTVETPAMQQAFGGITGTTFKNMTVEKFGNRAQTGAIQGSNLTIENSTVRLNHGIGVMQYGGVQRHNRIVSNGQLGLGGGGSGMVSEHNEVANNNHAGHNPLWEAGGMKWANSAHHTFRRNWVHHNEGPGIWYDIDNYLPLVEENLSEQNTEQGMFYEISYQAEIRRNLVRGNGTRTALFYNRRVGVLVANSRDVWFHHNRVEDNTGGGVLAAEDVSRNAGGSLHGTWELTNLRVESNTVRFIGSGANTGQVHGITLYGGSNTEYFTAKNNRFIDNDYTVPATTTTTGTWFLWQGAQKTWTAWQAYGNDLTGTNTGT
jgi:hypothetical protein